MMATQTDKIAKVGNACVSVDWREWRRLSYQNQGKDKVRFLIFDLGFWIGKIDLRFFAIMGMGVL